METGAAEHEPSAYCVAKWLFPAFLKGKPMRVIGLIQARMGSSRLPGKMMLPLDCTHAVQHVIRRVQAAEAIDSTVLATSDGRPDSILERYANREGVDVFKGDEGDVLGRMRRAAEGADADLVVRITGDDVLVSPAVIDALVEIGTDVDYAANTERIPSVEHDTFPVGLDVEVCTMESLSEVAERSDEPHQREHVTPYYYEHPEEFTLAGLTWQEVFEFEPPESVDDVWLGLDTPEDYELLRRVYENVAYDETVDVRDALDYVAANGLAELNAHVH